MPHSLLTIVLSVALATNPAVAFRCLQPDGLGSITSLISETSGFFRALLLKERYTYDSFGSPRITGPGPDGQMDTADDVTLTESALGNPYAFTGREYDPESGLYYHRGRYRDPRGGGFLQEDPLNYALLLRSRRSRNQNPMVAKLLLDIALQDAQGAHPYVYVRNNSINARDPLGLWGFGVDGSATVEGGVVAGGAGTASIGGGLFGGGAEGLNLGGFAAVGGFVGGPSFGVSFPCEKGGNFALGAFGGGGGGIFITNATAASQLAGPFRTISFDVGIGALKGSVQVSYAGGIWIASVTVGPGAGVGLSSLNTNTWTIGR